MVYLIALQDVNPCPFRVVDEINQAMDRHNERRIFEVITKATACQRSKTQYLLITPKLLPDLHYSKHTALHFVFNGCAARARARGARARGGRGARPDRRDLRRGVLRGCAARAPQAVQPAV